MKFEVEGRDMVRKEATKQSETASHVFVPKDWEGAEVAVILLGKKEK